MFDREKVVEAIVYHDFDSIVLNSAHDYLLGILKFGFRGFDDLSDEELIKECEDRDIDIEGLE